MCIRDRCDTNHVLHSDYSEIRIIGAGADAVDFALVTLCKKGDIVAVSYTHLDVYKRQRLL